jgi:hypothetical protein
MVVAALALVVVGVQARSAASHDRAGTKTARAALPAVGARDRAAHDAVNELTAASQAMEDKLLGASQAFGKAAAAEQAVVDAVNRGVRLRNQGDQAGATALFRTDAAAALTDFEQKSAIANEAVRAAQAAYDRLHKDVP